MDFTPLTVNFNHNGDLADPRERVAYVIARKVIKPVRSTIRFNGVKPLALRKADRTYDARPLHTDRGHLIGLQFGGPEKPENLVPMYGGFNGPSGPWGLWESELAEHLGRKGRSVDIEVWVTYPNIGSSVPSSFLVRVTAHSKHPLPTTLAGMRQMDMPIPVNHYQEPNDWQRDFGTLLGSYQNDMEAANWYVEKDQAVSPGIKKAALCVGERELQPSSIDFANMNQKRAFYDSRPYAVLDWMYFREKNYYQICGGPNMSGGFQNVSNFTGSQVNFIFQAAFARNGGFINSDLYGVHGVEDQRRLMLGSTDYQGQVDHVYGKASGGSNAFSNARIISAKMNKALNNDQVRDAVTNTWKTRAGL